MTDAQRISQLEQQLLDCDNGITSTSVTPPPPRSLIIRLLSLRQLTPANAPKIHVWWPAVVPGVARLVRTPMIPA